MQQKRGPTPYSAGAGFLLSSAQSMTLTPLIGYDCRQAAISCFNQLSKRAHLLFMSSGSGDKR